MFVFYGMYYKLKPSMYIGIFKSLKSYQIVLTNLVSSTGEW